MFSFFEAREFKPQSCLYLVRWLGAAFVEWLTDNTNCPPFGNPAKLYGRVAMSICFSYQFPSLGFCGFFLFFRGFLDVKLAFTQDWPALKGWSELSLEHIP